MAVKLCSECLQRNLMMVLLYFYVPQSYFFLKQSVVYRLSAGGRLLLHEVGLEDVNWINVAEYWS
jgi:hypothetical protein